MKKVWTTLLMALLANAAQAVPVTFDIAGSTLTANEGVGVAFEYDDNPFVVSLDDEESAAVTFGTVTALAEGSGNVSLEINFQSPALGNATETGTYSISTVVVFLFTDVSWDRPLIVDYQAGGMDGSLQIDIDDFFEIGGALPTWALTGTLTNLGSEPGPGPAPVPAPTTLALLGFGLAGLIARRRRAS